MTNLRVIVEDLDEHPQCVHGPMLLFARKVHSDGTCVEEQFFGCACCRDPNECRRTTQLDGSQKSQIAHTVTDVLRAPASSRTFCKTCAVWILDGDGDNTSHARHATVSRVSDHLIRNPTQLLPPLSVDTKEAQYFFGDGAIDCFLDIFKEANLRKVICIGAPRLHESIRTRYPDQSVVSILLDIDQRLHNFYGPDEYLPYNMFNDHFFDGDTGRRTFETFLTTALCGADRAMPCLFVDPPFGCRTEPLAYTIRTIQRQFQILNRTHEILPIFLVFPYYMEPYVHNDMAELEMVDYRVDYTNHKTYHSGVASRKQGSPVRLFTNVLSSLIRLPRCEGYRHCGKCARWVSTTNAHCDRCGRCPSKNGSTYVHCDKCELCVKPSYRHCDECNRCTQVQGHNCANYICHTSCWICRRKGHGERQCPFYTVSPAKAKHHRRRLCLLCARPSHNELNCDKRERVLDEFSFLGKFTNRFNKEKCT